VLDRAPQRRDSSRTQGVHTGSRSMTSALPASSPETSTGFHGFPHGFRLCAPWRPGRGGQNANRPPGCAPGGDRRALGEARARENRGCVHTRGFRSPALVRHAPSNKRDFSVSRKMFCIWFTNHATVTAEASE
jgi:hypothetical protein